MNRRDFLARMLAGGVVTAAGIWMPGEKLISIASKRYFVPDSVLAWFMDGKAYVQQQGGVIEVPAYFDVQIRGAELAPSCAHLAAAIARV